MICVVLIAANCWVLIAMICIVDRECNWVALNPLIALEESAGMEFVDSDLSAAVDSIAICLELNMFKS